MIKAWHKTKCNLINFGEVKFSQMLLCNVNVDQSHQCLLQRNMYVRLPCVPITQLPKSSYKSSKEQYTHSLRVFSVWEHAKSHVSSQTYPQAPLRGMACSAPTPHPNLECSAGRYLIGFTSRDGRYFSGISKFHLTT